MFPGRVPWVPVGVWMLSEIAGRAAERRASCVRAKERLGSILAGAPGLIDREIVSWRVRWWPERRG